MEITNKPRKIILISPAITEKPPVSISDQINLNVFWIANNFHWQALLAIVIPSMVAKFLGDANKDINLTIVVFWGTLVAVVVNPLIGAVSDYVTFRMGRRRPFMIIGTVLNVIVLAAFAFAPNLSPGILLFMFAFLFLLLQFSNNFANSPWSAIIADNVPSQQRGLTAGFNGLFTLLGTIAGSVVAGLIVNKNDPLPLYRNEIVQIFLLIAAVQIFFVAYTILTVKETPLPPEQHIALQCRPSFSTHRSPVRSSLARCSCLLYSLWHCLHRSLPVGPRIIGDAKDWSMSQAR